MISLRSNTRGKTVMTEKDYSAMSGSQLVETYNALAKEKGIKPIKRFSDHKTAVRRVTDLANGTIPQVHVANGGGVKVERVLLEFGTRKGTNRESLVKALAANFGKQVSTINLIKEVYGKEDEKLKTAIGMVMKGAFDMIKKNSLPYKIIYDKETKSYGLYKK